MTVRRGLAVAALALGPLLAACEDSGGGDRGAAAAKEAVLVAAPEGAEQTREVSVSEPGETGGAFTDEPSTEFVASTEWRIEDDTEPVIRHYVELLRPDWPTLEVDCHPLASRGVVLFQLRAARWSGDHRREVLLEVSPITAGGTTVSISVSAPERGDGGGPPDEEVDVGCIDSVQIN